MSQINTKSMEESRCIIPLATSTPMPAADMAISKIHPVESSKKPSKPSSKKAIVKKTLVAKTTSSNATIKPSNNHNKENKSVELILAQKKLSKYARFFKTYDVDRFKQLSELDLNAMGITRPQELRIFKDAIIKAKSEI